LNRKRKMRLVMILGMITGVGITVSLVLFALNKNINVYYTPSQLTDNLPRHNLRIGGLVKKGSLHREPNSLRMIFTITDLHKDLTIHYDGIVPSLFREGQGVVVEGRFASGKFIASQVLAKHDEKYMPPGISRKD
jgi:cytochrome c-type biogenesis protein CcmE